MEALKRYRKRADRPVIAVRLDLDTDGFTYTKWGGPQRCKRGDWLVDNDGEIYTIDAEVFARTYRQTAPGQYVKTTRVWARVAGEAGRIKTREGFSRYSPGDYLVYNDPDEDDGYCMAPERFTAMYEEDA